MNHLLFQFYTIIILSHIFPCIWFLENQYLFSLNHLFTLFFICHSFFYLNSLPEIIFFSHKSISLKIISVSLVGNKLHQFVFSSSLEIGSVDITVGYFLAVLESIILLPSRVCISIKKLIIWPSFFCSQLIFLINNY